MSVVFFASPKRPRSETTARSPGKSACTAKYVRAAARSVQLSFENSRSVLPNVYFHVRFVRSNGDWGSCRSSSVVFAAMTYEVAGSDFEVADLIFSEAACAAS